MRPPLVASSPWAAWVVTKGRDEHCRDQTGMNPKPPWGLVAIAPLVAHADGPDPAVAAIASAQHGLIATAHLRFAGLGKKAVARRVRDGRLFRLHRGVYLVGHTASGELTQFAGAILAMGPQALISNRSAAVLWRMMDPQPGPVHVMVPVPSGRQRPGIAVHRMAAFDPRDRRRHRGLPLTSPALTLLDLAEDEEPIVVERALNEARERSLVSQSKLGELLARTSGRRGAAILGPLFRSQTNEDFSRKEAERVLWNLLRSAELPLPRRNVRVHGFELDFFWPELTLNVETDGNRWHSARNRVNADRDRDTKLAAHGIQVLRFTWDQLQRPNRVLARIAAAIALAAQRRGAPSPS